MNFRQLAICAAASVSVIAASEAVSAEPKTFQNPEMTLFLAPDSIADGRSVVILPGGGYSHVAINHEGFDWAPFFNSRGISCAVVNYRMPKGDRSIPVGDAEAAIKLMKDSAEVWHLDPSKVGIMGSSAGGHLASTVATHAAPELRPAFQILFYPVISLEQGITHKGSRDNFLGPEPSEELVREFSNYYQVDSLTPRAFIILSADDRAVPCRNGVGYFEALRAEDIPASLHVFPTGGHGWGSRTTFKYHPLVEAELSAWLDSFK